MKLRKQFIFLSLVSSFANVSLGHKIASSALCDPYQSSFSQLTEPSELVQKIPRGGGWSLAGWNPFGYKITALGERFLGFEGSLDSDVGRFLASLKNRKTRAALKSQWVEIVKVSKTGQTMRIYRTLDDLIKFCLDAGFID
jgi:hypothetical protein